MVRHPAQKPRKIEPQGDVLRYVCQAPLKLPDSSLVVSQLPQRDRGATPIRRFAGPQQDRAAKPAKRMTPSSSPAFQRAKGMKGFGVIRIVPNDLATYAHRGGQSALAVQ